MTIGSFGRAAALVLLAALTLAASARKAAAQTTVDGIIYGSYRHGLTADTSFAASARQSNFDIERSYLNVRSKSEGGITSRVTVDVDGRRAAANQLSFRLKYAFVAWTPEGSRLNWKFGLQNTPIVGYIEDLWGYRMQGPVAIDRNRYQSSSDFGLAVDGATQDQRVNFDAGLFNGESYSSAPGDNHKDLAGRVSVRLLETDNASKTGGLRLTGFASLGKATGGADRQRFLGMLSYQTKAVTLGAEYTTTTDSTAASADTKGRLMSLFGAYQRVGSKVGVIARMDRWDPNADLSPATASLTASAQTRVIAGLSYQFAKNVRLLFDADVVSVQNGPAINTFEAANRSVFVHTEIKF